MPFDRIDSEKNREEEKKMARIRHIGGERVTKGNYWNFSNGDRITLDYGGVLPGSKATTYYKANPLFILAAGPVLGLIYAAFLPFIGLAIIAKMVFTKLFGRALEGLPRVAAFNWSPSEAYLAGRRRKKKVMGNNKEDKKSDEAEKK
jgi:hypothetical protein